jgi:hypothetical protein
MSDDNWEGAEIISVYDDSQAIEDGVIVDISELKLAFQGRSLNRMTRGLWEDFQPFITIETTFPGIQAPTPMEELRKIMRTKLQLARCTGGIWTLPPGLWLIENEVGGWTVMKPEEY